MLLLKDYFGGSAYNIPLEVASRMFFVSGRFFPTLAEFGAFFFSFSAALGLELGFVSFSPVWVGNRFSPVSQVQTV